MAALVPTRLTPQDFGDCLVSITNLRHLSSANSHQYPIPRARNGGAAGGLGRGYPAGGTTAQYKRLHRIDLGMSASYVFALLATAYSCGVLPVYFFVVCWRPILVCLLTITS